MSNVKPLDDVDGYILLCAIHAGSGQDPFLEQSLSRGLLQRVQERRGTSSKSIRETLRDVESRGLVASARKPARSLQEFLSSLSLEHVQSTSSGSER